MLDYSHLSPPKMEAVGPWFRVHQTVNGAVFFGRTGKYRWDSPNHTYGVLYVGESWEAAFLESVLHDPVKKTVLKSELEKRSMGLLKTNTPLQLIDLSDGTVLRDLGLTESETQARAYKKTQGISEAIHDAGWNVHGIRYASRLDPNRLCMALFDCPTGMIAVNDLEPLLAPSNDGLLRFTLKHYRIPLIEDLTNPNASW
jgi:RES domain